ncbi:MAG: 50S ribosomal protein L13 [Candidatus Aenigmarchaeota archaeon]|nr:50S ribosomal protein L13 [Candidatus Aenigmarchaeota archaeon]
MERIFIDAENQIAGRLASKVAKESLKGRYVIIVNAEKAVITGNPKFVIKRYFEMVSRGDPYHGPFYPKVPDRMLKRIIRGMLPHRKPNGRMAFRRIRVYNSVPEEFSKETFQRMESGSRLSSKFITLGKLSERLGAKKLTA